MKHFINLKDIPAKDLRRILTDAKKEKMQERNLIILIPIKEHLKRKIIDTNV